jgi:hypothetical protein
MMFWLVFFIGWAVSFTLIVAFTYGASERRQCEHRRRLVSPPHYCLDCGMEVADSA